jgi:hypothetical protein
MSLVHVEHVEHVEQPGFTSLFLKLDMTLYNIFSTNSIAVSTYLF